MAINEERQGWPDIQCLLRVFPVYKKVADSGNLVIQRQGFSIVDTHEPAIAMPLFPF